MRPRIRSIHPSLWTEEAVMGLSPFALLYYLGLQNHADDGGAFEWKPTSLRVRIMPQYAQDGAELLAELERAGLVRRYAVAGREYGALRDFGRAQRPVDPFRMHPMPEALAAWCGTADVPPPRESPESFESADSQAPIRRRDSGESASESVSKDRRFAGSGLRDSAAMGRGRGGVRAHDDGGGEGGGEGGGGEERVGLRPTRPAFAGASAGPEVRARDSQNDEASRSAAQRPLDRRATAIPDTEVKSRLWSDGLRALCDLTDLPQPAAAQRLGRLIKFADGDCAAVLSAIGIALTAAPANPMAFIQTVIRRQLNPLERPPRPESVDDVLAAAGIPPFDDALAEAEDPDLPPAGSSVH